MSHVASAGSRVWLEWLARARSARVASSQPRRTVLWRPEARRGASSTRTLRDITARPASRSAGAVERVRALPVVVG
jgi:hypothetical protein